MTHAATPRSRLTSAVESNARWCDLVCRSHGLPTELSHQTWLATRRSPRFYPDAVTLAPGVEAGHLLARIDTSAGCSVKDSFCDLDLTAYGFDVLFSARWLVAEPAALRTSVPWRQVTSTADLTRWTTAAGLRGVIRPSLLGDGSVRILAAGERHIRAGAILHRVGTTVGLSNVFGPEPTAGAIWCDLRAVVAGCRRRLDIVGYEHGSALDAANAAGFTSIGQLRVWHRPAI